MNVIQYTCTCTCIYTDDSEIRAITQLIYMLYMYMVSYIVFELDPNNWTYSTCTTNQGITCTWLMIDDKYTCVHCIYTVHTVPVHWISQYKCTHVHVCTCVCLCGIPKTFDYFTIQSNLISTV